ncbi:MAG: oxalate:formate antiporter [Solirubrobacteraceae bacterium]
MDIKVIALRDLAHRVEDAHVLWERDGAVRDATAATTAVWPAPDGQWIEDRFWVWVHYGATKIGRGELFECLELLTLLRSAALGPLIAREHAQRPQGVRRIERYAPELVDALAAAVRDHSRAGCTAALRTAADLYRELRARAADAGLKPRADAERAALAFLDALG